MRTIVLPFEVALAATAIWSGMAGLFNMSLAAAAFNAALPPWLVTIFNIVYVVSGFGIVAGVGWGYRHLEGFGLTLLLMSLLVRAIAIFATMGWGLLTTNIVIQALFFGGACVVRIIVLLKEQSFIERAALHATVGE